MHIGIMQDINVLSKQLQEKLNEVRYHLKSYQEAKKMFDAGNLSQREYYLKSEEFLGYSIAIGIMSAEMVLKLKEELDIIKGKILAFKMRETHSHKMDISPFDIVQPTDRFYTQTPSRTKHQMFCDILGTLRDFCSPSLVASY